MGVVLAVTEDAICPQILMLRRFKWCCQESRRKGVDVRLLLLGAVKTFG